MSNDKAILVVSFGTSYNDNRARTIGAIEELITYHHPDWEVRRAFTSRMIIRKLAERDNEKIDYVTDAMERLANDGFRTVIVQPTHIMNGDEFEKVESIVEQYKGRFEKLCLGKPLLTTDLDYDMVMDAVDEGIVKESANLGHRTAIVLMGHGSEHYANATYSQLQMKFITSGRKDVYVTTVEGYPSFEDTLKLMEGKGYTDVALYPFMLVAGDHANNDMAGDDEDSLKKVMEAAGYNVHCFVKGLGEIQPFQNLFLAHADQAIDG